MSYSISFHTFGCKLNFVDTNNIAKDLANNFNLKESDLTADIHIINTCAVTSVATRKAKNLIKKILKTSDNSKVFVIGCSVRADSITYKDNNRVVILDNKKTNMSSFIKQLYGIDDLNSFVESQKPLSVFRTRVFVKIQEGCDSFCTYCIVPYLRGRENSRKIYDIISEIQELEKLGVEEVVLTGTAIGKYSYGLFKLLVAIIDETSTIRVRLSSLRPNEITKKIIELMKNNRICPHLHVSFQSGSDRILKLMGRKDYNAKELLRVRRDIDEVFKIKTEKENIGENIFLAADIIVGFPTETEEDFKETVSILEQTKMTYLHVFPYSPRPKTPAASMKQVQSTFVKQRKDILNKLSNKNFDIALNNMIGKTVDIVWENRYGRTDNYFKVESLNNKKTRKMLVNSVKNSILQVVEIQ